MTEYKNMKTKGLIFMAIASSVLCSCTDQLSDIPLVELGTPTTEFVLEADGGIVDLKICSNGPYHIESVGEQTG